MTGGTARHFFQVNLVCYTNKVKKMPGAKGNRVSIKFKNKLIILIALINTSVFGPVYFHKLVFWPLVRHRN